MRLSTAMLALCAAGASCAAAQGSSWVGWNTAAPSRYILLGRGKYNGTLHAMDIPGGKYNASQPPMVADLHGSSYEQGVLMQPQRRRVGAATQTQMHAHATTWKMLLCRLRLRVLDGA